MKPFKFFRDNTPRVEWRTAGGLRHPLTAISTNHIMNIMNCLSGMGNMTIPEPYDGRTRREWFVIFHNELVRRRHANI
jgi:hypothetical protein